MSHIFITTFDNYEINERLNNILHVRIEVSCRGRPIHSVYFRFRGVVELLGERHCGDFSCQTEHINSLLIIDLTNTSVSVQ